MPKAPRLPAALLLLLVALAPARAQDEALRVTPERDGLELTRSATLAPGTWTVRERDGTGVIRIRTDGVVLDLAGAILRGAPEDADPSALAGVGILVEGARGVTIRGGSVAGFRVGIRAVDAPGLVVEDVDASGNFRQRLGSTPEHEDSSDWLWPHENDANEWETRYGAGFSLTGCEGSTVRRCRVRHGQNGLLLTRSTGCIVYDNDFSFNSGWGIALYRTTHAEVSHNRLDFCVRGYSHGVYHRGQDSAAILVFEQSSDNLFVRNSATHSGDGFFLYAGRETTQRTGRGGCNHNRVLANDFRFAVANGIEATFSEGNVFAQNDCSGSDYGIWGGYSYRSAFAFNTLRDCLTAGLAIEHGHDNRIVGNRVEGAPYGIHLWWDEDPDLLASSYGRAQDGSSARNTVASNVLAGTLAAIRLDRDVGSTIDRNTFPAATTRVQLLGATQVAGAAGNRVDGDLVVENRTGNEILLPDDNTVAGTLTATGDPVRAVPSDPAPEAPSPPAPEALPLVRGSQDPRLASDLPASRASIRIDEWGPVDPRGTRLFPARQTAAGAEARVHLLGSKPFEVVETSDGVRVEPRSGTAPATLVVRSVGDGPALRPFHVAVQSDGARHVAQGLLLCVTWKVGFHAWDEGAHPLEKPEAFAALLAGAARATVEAEALDFAWRGDGPAGVGPDRFATRATATVELPPGRYRFRVVSDDGVRLFVDGRVVIERWDRHGPVEDVALVELAAGSHDLVVEHFEIDGWAWLALRLEAAP